ncbi:P-loop containing nucleoside triphosphate hydrolase protein [Zopfia rhizophila CBS 207.26]|uniref:RNA helicase n=1 Tax=Zopfia rhizophila CBS 207.26 TaxID=1314779 RepID=A0A6A6E058_9PEZI|nr:P-loop containing nucleoside triphosphate hydrolase protein [Zopfia rhizophila CBS 207.26]
MKDVGDNVREDFVSEKDAGCCCLYFDFEMPKFVPRQRKHKVLARQQRNGGKREGGADVNAAEILPAEKKEREERKRALKEELLRESQGKMSGKKKKRLDKYIDTKLKKEENLVLLKKLAAQKVDTSLFQSSKRLGSGEDTKKERLKRAMLERRAGVDVERNEGLLMEKSTVAEMSEGEDEEAITENEKPSIFVPMEQKNGTVDIHSAPQNRDLSPLEPEKDNNEEGPISAPTVNIQPGFGSGLKRRLELDEGGKPIIKTRKRLKAKGKAIHVEEEMEWEGFSSEEGEISSAEIHESSERSASSSATDSDEDVASRKDEEEQDSASDASEIDSEYEEESDTSVDEDSKALRKERVSAFKAWATQQKNEVIGFTPSTNITYAIPTKLANFEPRAPELDPLPPELQTKTATDATRKAFSVAVERSSEIQASRLQLPIVAEEQKIMEAIHNNDVVVVWGATGSGKTTQVPQFLYEAGYGAPDGPTPGMIGVTQPRRVAAVSMSKRVGDELGDAGSKVAYQIRFDTSTSAKTAIKFMTDGVLLREISQDFMLTKYSAIIIDEAHERSVNTDILIGMLSRIVDLRTEKAREDPKNKPLKLVIMSATLRISDFTENNRLFRHGPPPLMKAEGRQYPVTNHFSRRTQRDYIEEAFRKVCRGHRKLPRGGILVFLTGQNEIAHLAKRLKQAFASTQGHEAKAGQVYISPAEAPLETEDIDLGGKSKDALDNDDSDSEESVLTGLDNDDDGEFDIGEEAIEQSVMKVHVLPLYSQLPTNEQLRVFEPPPGDSRLVVLATNVAETSLTIPGIRYVFDCGRAKEKKYDPITGVQSFEVGWISKASANQRAGRAGRTGPGHCYRLYSSAVFERDFEEYAPPEIQRTPLEGVVLQLKSMGAPVINFPFPSPPDRDSLQKAEKLLSYLGAISSDGKVTKLGHELSLYPLNPRFARMLVTGIAQKLTAETIALVASLSLPELIIPENKLGLRDPPANLSAIRIERDNVEAAERSRLRKAYNAAQVKLSANAKQSDCIRFNNAVCAYAHEADPETFCDKMFLNSKAMHEASQLRRQLTMIVRTHRPAVIGTYQPKLPAPSESAVNLLKQICAAGFIDQVAMRADLAPVPPELPRKPKTAIDVPYVTLFSSHTGRRNTDDPLEQFVYIHPSSLLAHTSVKSLPGFVIYSYLQRATPSTIAGGKTPKTRMHPLTPVTRPQLINIALGTPLLGASKPKGKILDLERDTTGAERRECEVWVSLVGEKGSQDWGLGIRKVIQKKEGAGKGWVIEKVIPQMDLCPYMDDVVDTGCISANRIDLVCFIQASRAVFFRLTKPATHSAYRSLRRVQVLTGDLSKDILFVANGIFEAPMLAPLDNSAKDPLTAQRRRHNDSETPISL